MTQTKPDFIWKYFITNAGMSAKARMTQDDEGEYTFCYEAWIPDTSTGKLKLHNSTAGIIMNDTNLENEIKEKDFAKICMEIFSRNET
jgi:hypothetical protein